MELVASRVFSVLVEKGISELYHANSVITSCQFLRYRTLMSRGTVERMGLSQTSQDSDDDDRRFGLWFDVFTDSVDIHSRARRANIYGPVLFILDIEIIAKTYTGKISVTKLNPIKWAGKSNSERWFQSIQDLEENFTVGRFDQMIVFRHCGGELPFDKFLKGVEIDDPELTAGHAKIDYFSMAYGAIRSAMNEWGNKIPVSKRKCSDACSCVRQYQRDFGRAKQMFRPFE
jgi:hypothetical protein